MKLSCRYIYASVRELEYCVGYICGMAGRQADGQTGKGKAGTFRKGGQRDKEAGRRKWDNIKLQLKAKGPTRQTGRHGHTDWLTGQLVSIEEDRRKVVGTMAHKSSFIPSAMQENDTEFPVILSMKEQTELREEL